MQYNLNKTISSNVRPYFTQVPEHEQFLSKIYPLVIKDFVPKNICREFIELHKTQKLKPAYGLAADGSAIKNTSYRNDSKVEAFDLSKLKPWYTINNMAKHINNYWMTNFSYAVIKECAPIYSVFNPGEYCRPHLDVVFDGNVMARPSRRLSTILYLNGCEIDENVPDSFSGGELEFLTVTDQYGEIVRIQPAAGDLIIFPAHPFYRHAVSDITSGERHNIVSFLEIKK